MRFLIVAFFALLTFAVALPLRAGADDGVTRVAFAQPADHGALPADFVDGGYYFARPVEYSFEEAAQRVRDAFKAEGFGVQYELRPDEVLREKIGYEMPPYLIVGVCQPKSAAGMLDIDQWMGILLPCNAIVRTDAAGQVWVAVQNPLMIEAETGNPAMADIELAVLHSVIKVLAEI